MKERMSIFIDLPSILPVSPSCACFAIILLYVWLFYHVTGEVLYMTVPPESPRVEEKRFGRKIMPLPMRVDSAGS